MALLLSPEHAFSFKYAWLHSVVLRCASGQFNIWKALKMPSYNFAPNYHPSCNLVNGLGSDTILQPVILLKKSSRLERHKITIKRKPVASCNIKSYKKTDLKETKNCSCYVDSLFQGVALCWEYCYVANCKDLKYTMVWHT